MAQYGWARNHHIARSAIWGRDIPGDDVFVDGEMGAQRRFGWANNKTRGSHEAVNCQTLWRKLATKIET